MILYQTLNQFLIFLKIACAGIFSNLIIIIFDIIKIKNKKFNFVNNFFQFFAYCAVFFIYFSCNLKLNYGEFRLFFTLTFFVSFFVFRFLIKKFVAKTKLRCYNKQKEKSDERTEKLVEKSDSF